MAVESLPGLVDTPSPTATAVDTALYSMFRDFPGARVLWVANRPTGTLAYLIVDAEETEEAAYRRLAGAYRLLAGQPVEFVVATDSSHLVVGPGWRAYELGQ